MPHIFADQVKGLAFYIKKEVHRRNVKETIYAGTERD